LQFSSVTGRSPAGRIQDEQIYAGTDRYPETFWEKFADELMWSCIWDKVLDWQPPDAERFVGGQLNASVNCLDEEEYG
jgi:acetyl-CoA synthetase